MLWLVELPEPNTGDTSSPLWGHRGGVELNRRCGNCHRSRRTAAAGPRRSRCRTGDTRTNPPVTHPPYKSTCNTQLPEWELEH